MKKDFLFGSVIVSIALFSGCGSSGGSSDTTAPKFTNSIYSFTPTSGVDETVPLKATDEGTVTFTEDSTEAEIDGTNLIFHTPNYNSSSVNKYTVNVTAKDKAGNSTTKAFIFDIKENITKVYKLNPQYIAKTDGSKVFTDVGGYLEDPSGLLWDDTVSSTMTYSAADSYCKAKGTGWRIPTRAEFLNIIDYSKSSASLIDSDFTNYSDASIGVSWVENLTSDKYVVTHTGGVDTNLTNNVNHTVLCVYGDKNMTAHTFQPEGSDFKDNVTNLTWKVVSATESNYNTANSGCANPWKLPTINQLRSIINYNNNTIASEIITGSPTYIWSSTQGKAEVIDGNTTHYTLLLDGNNTKAGVMLDQDRVPHFYTCVK